MRLLQPEEPWNGSPEVAADEIIVAINRTELAGLANSIGEALQAIDDWEFDTRVGLLPTEARALRDQISEALRATFRPE